jgi:hypothetical protein
VRPRDRRKRRRALRASEKPSRPRLKNAHHGIDAVVGEIAWLGFLIAALATVVLIAGALYQHRGRDATRAART